MQSILNTYTCTFCVIMYAAQTAHSVAVDFILCMHIHVYVFTIYTCVQYYIEYLPLHIQ